MNVTRFFCLILSVVLIIGFPATGLSRSADKGCFPVSLNDPVRQDIPDADIAAIQVLLESWDKAWIENDREPILAC